MIDETLILGIQWKDSAGNERFSVSDYVDIVSHPGYVIFNWDIDNTVTANAGPISFSVRIYRVDANHRVTYSFSTLTATSFISNALDYDVVSLIEGESMNDLILGRLTNSPAPADTGDAEEPQIILALPANVDLDPLTMVKQLLVQAVSPDGGRISYSWKFKPYGSETEGTFGGATDPKLYKITEDENFIVDNDYFIKGTITNGIQSYILLRPDTEYVIGGSIAEYKAEHDDVDIYELYASAIADAVGQYSVVVNNRCNGSNKAVVVGPCVVPGPSAFTVTPSHGRIGNFLTSSGKCALSVDRASLAPVEYGPADNFITNWYEDQIDDDHRRGISGYAFTAGEDMNTHEGVPSEQRSMFDHTYIAQTVATRNGVQSLPSEVNLQYFRVTADPEDYKQVLNLSSNTVTLTSANDVQEVTVSISNADSIIADSYSYQWYKDLAVNGGAIGINQIEEGDEMLPGETNATIQFSETQNPNIGASGIGNYYYCVVTRTLNGKDTVVVSNSVYLGKSY